MTKKQREEMLKLLALLALLSGCAAEVKEVRVPVNVPLLVAPNCALDNVFGRCKVRCLEHGMRPT